MKHGHRAVYKFLQPALESACRQLCLCNRNRPQRRMTEVATGSWVSREETFGAAEVRGDSRGQIPWGSWAGRMCFQTRLLVEVSHVTGTSKPCGRVERSHTLTSFHYCRSQRVVSSSSKRNAICKTQHCPLPAGGTETPSQPVLSMRLLPMAPPGEDSVQHMVLISQPLPAQ